MRVRILANPPLPPVKAWFPLTLPFVQSTPTISSFKSILCTSFPAFRGVSPSSLRLSIDGFELLDNSEFTVVRDGDLICVDVLDVLPQDATARDRVIQGASDATHGHGIRPVALRKRKRRLSTPSSSSSESEAESTTSPSASESGSKSETSSSESTSDSDDSSRPTTPSWQKAEPPKVDVREQAQATPLVQPKAHVAGLSTFVPPGYGKPQTRARNLRRRLKRVYEREAAGVSEGGPVSGANAVTTGKDAPVEAITPDSSRGAHSGLLSLSLRNKNKAKNFKSLIGRPLAPKIIFGDQEGASTSDAMVTPEGATPARAQSVSARVLPRLIPPSSRSSLPPNLFVTSVDVEAGLHREKKKRKMRIKYDDDVDVTLDYGDDVDKMPEPESEADIARLEAIAAKEWGSLERLTREEQVKCGMIVGYKALGINALTCTPEQCLTVGRVVSCDSKGVVMRLMRAREQVSFSGPVGEQAVDEAAEWGDILSGDWRLM